MYNNYIHTRVTLDGYEHALTLSVDEAKKLCVQLARAIDVAENIDVQELDFDEEVVLDNYVAAA